MLATEREGAVAVGSRDALYHPSCREKDGLMVPDDLPARIASKIRVNETTGCWEWIASVRYDGYGQVFWLDSTKGPRLAHRIVYSLLVGTIPEGLTIDHLCRVRHCVKPAHLEPVTNAENLRRGESPFSKKGRQTHCKRGHEFTAENTRLRIHSTKGTLCRCCRECDREYARAFHQREREDRNG